MCITCIELYRDIEYFSTSGGVLRIKRLIHSSSTSTAVVTAVIEVDPWIDSRITLFKYYLDARGYKFAVLSFERTSFNQFNVTCEYTGMDNGGEDMEY